MTFSTIEIIYNPKSSGPSKEYARQLQRDLHLKHKLRSHLHATKYAGHAEELAYALSLANKHPLIVSSSGDGGYHEVINGAMKAQQEGAHPTCAVLAAGNANDHARNLVESSLLEAIASQKVRRIDVLKMKVVDDGDVSERYAHSYVGFGLSPAVAVELNQTDLNIFKEIFIVARNILSNRSFVILHKDSKISLDSLVISNIGEMAKILKFSKDAKPDDGMFEVSIFARRGKSDLIRRLWRTTRGLEKPKSFKEFRFTLAHTTHAQLDGEVMTVAANSEVTLTSEHQLLQTIG